MSTSRSARLSRRRSTSARKSAFALLPWQWGVFASLPAFLFAGWFLSGGNSLPAKPEPMVVASKVTELAAAPASLAAPVAEAAPKMTLEFAKLLAEPEESRIQPVMPVAATSASESVRQTIVAAMDAKKEPAVPAMVSPERPAETARNPAPKPVERPAETARNPAPKPVERPAETAKKPDPTPVATKPATPSKMVVRVGSYHDKSTAEAKRAELMLNGVQTQVVSYKNSSGKEVHLLQTSPMAADQAKVIHQRLQLRNYSSQLRNAS